MTATQGDAKLLMESVIQPLQAPYEVAINFHGVGTPQRALEPGEDLYWISENQFAAMVNEIRCYPRKVLITFDDGNSSDLTICAPLLVTADLKATFFVLAGRIGTQGSLSKADLHSLLNLGMHIGSHGFDHVDWTKLDEAGFERELKNARDVIAAATGVRANIAAIPFGKYDRRVLRELNVAGYDEIYSSDGGDITSSFRVIPRTSVRADMTIGNFQNILHGREPLLKKLRRRASMIKKNTL
jgi:peptidoglycan/xylan/chitin deacetylase (PgdA/CDA1 family)